MNLIMLELFLHYIKTNHIEVPMGVDCIKDLPNLLSTIEPLSDSS